MPAVVDFETAPQLVRRLAAHYAGTGKPALGYRDRDAGWVDVTWDDLFDRATAFAGFLHARGVGHGDRVAILSENRVEWAVTDLATQLVGAATVALYPTLPADQVAFIVADSGAKVLVASTGLQVRKADAAFESCPDLVALVAMSRPTRVRASVPVSTWDGALTEGRRTRALLDFDALEAAVAPDDLSALIYTSGTTGEPKGVMMTHRNLMENAKAAISRIGVGEGDVHLSFLPLSHAFERTCGHTAMLAVGAQVVYAESIDTVARNLPEVRPTVMISVPRLFERIYTAIQRSAAEGSAVTRATFAWAVGVGTEVAARRKAGRSVPPHLRAQHALAKRLVFSVLTDKLGGRVRFAVSGGAALPAEIGTFFEAAGLPIIEGYGLSETAPILAANPVEAPVYGTVGKVVPTVTLAVRDLASGRLLAEVSGDDPDRDVTTAPGEILAKGPNVMPGYWGRPAATAEAFDAEGWFRTGDVGRFEGGYLRITDRLKHMLVTAGGKNVYPGPIEAALTADPAVGQVLVVGEGRPFLTALVVADPDAPAAPDLDALLRAHNRSAASHEKVRDARLVAEPFTVENGQMTPTMKLKRAAIEAAHAGLIAAMYPEA